MTSEQKPKNLRKTPFSLTSRLPAGVVCGFRPGKNCRQKMTPTGVAERDQVYLPTQKGKIRFNSGLILFIAPHPTKPARQGCRYAPERLANCSFQVFGGRFTYS